MLVYNSQHWVGRPLVVRVLWYCFEAVCEAMVGMLSERGTVGFRCSFRDVGTGALHAVQSQWSDLSQLVVEWGASHAVGVCRNELVT